MCYDQERLGTPADALETLAEVLGIKSSQAFIQNNQVRVLKQSSCEENTAALPLRQLPACFTNHVVESARHPLKQGSQPQFEAQLPRLLKILRRMRVGPPHQQVERQRRRENMIFVILRCGCNAPPPISFAARLQIQSSGQDEARRWPAYARDQ